MIKLSKWAKKNDLTYTSAWTLFHKGKIRGAYQLESGTIVVPDDQDTDKMRPEFTVCYARVSSIQNKSNLEKQAERLTLYANARGYKVSQVVKEVGSGLIENRPKLLKLLESEQPTRIIVEHKDRLTRFGFTYIELLCKTKGITLEVINEVHNDKEDLIQDFISVITSSCARIYGQRRCKRKTETFIKELETNVHKDI